MRKWVFFGLVLAMVAVAVVRFARDGQIRPRGGSGHSRSSPAAPPAEPGAPVDRELTDEERVLAAARAYLLAWHEWEFEQVWELMSIPARGGWTGDDPRTAFLVGAKEHVESPSARDRVAGEQPTVVIDEDLATVTWQSAGLRLFLGREEGGFKVHFHTFAEGGFEMVLLTDGRRVPAVVIYDMIRKDEADFEAWWARLPRLSGEGTVEPDCDGTLEDAFDRVIRLFVDRTGRVKRFGREMASDDFLEFLFQHADSSRDYEHPNQPSTVPVALHLDRGFPVGEFRKLLLKLTDSAVRFGWVHVAARYANTPAERAWYDVGFVLHFDRVMYLTTLRVREQKTAVDLVLRDSEEATFGEDLAAKLKALPEEDRKKGVSLRCGPGVPTERLLKVLHVLAQQEDLRVVLDLREEQVPETRWGLELEGKPVSLRGLSGKVETGIKLEVWR